MPRWTVVSTALIALAACRDKVDPATVDADEDGWVAPDDCNDENPNVNPGEDEVCDSFDNNCDGVVDDDATDRVAWYTDGDGDGFGDPATEELRCDLPSDRVDDGTDCEDGDAAIFPGADEARNGVDDDCDGTVDEDDATDAGTWYLDADGDGFGVSGETTRACAVPEGYAERAGDCDDTDPQTYPWAEEICDDGIDQDCNGHPDNTCLVTWTTEEADFHIAGSAEADYAGLALTTPDLDGDGDVELVVGAPGNDDRATSSGKVYVLDGPIDGGTTLDDAIATVTPLVRSVYMGFALGQVDDLTGDGTDELVVSAFGADDLATNAGAVWLFNGPLTESHGPDVATAAIWGAEASGSLGMLLARGAGDLDHDGTPDLLVGAHGADDLRGAVYAFFGPITGTRTTDEAPLSVSGTAAGGTLGYAAAGPVDLDGDGADDLVLGEPGVGAGYMFAFLGPVSGALTLTDADLLLGGEADGDAFGSLVAAGDLDGDGATDLAVGASEADALDDSAGAILVLFAPTSGASPGYALHGDQSGSGLGHQEGDLQCADLDADGTDDLVVGWQGDDRQAENAGGAYLVFGPMAGSWSAGRADVALLGASASYLEGYAAEPGDLDGDGAMDLAVGAKYGPDQTGAVDVFLEIGEW